MNHRDGAGFFLLAGFSAEGERAEGGGVYVVHISALLQGCFRTLHGTGVLLFLHISIN